MKRIIIYTFSVLAILLLGSCNDFLDKDPFKKAALDSPTAVSQFLVSGYPDITYYQFLESMTDNAGDVRLWYNNSVNLDIQQPFWFEDVSSDQQDSPIGYWNSVYYAIAVANISLEAIENATDGKDYSAQKAEALLCRAYGHFMLVNIFAKPYDPTTAATDLGIPYVKEVEKEVFRDYERGTVKGVYDKIEEDLLAGLTDIGKNNFSVPKYHFNVQAAYAFATRFYLYTGNFEEAIRYATLCLGETSPTESLRNLNGTPYLSSEYQVYETRFTSAEEPANLLIASTISLYNRISITSRYKLSPVIKDEIFKTNVAGGELSYQFYTYTLGERTIHTPKFKEYFKRTSINANYGWPHIMSLLFTADEVLLNRAEAYAMLNTADGTTKAIQDLNYFYSKRIKNYSTASHAITMDKIDRFLANTNPELGRQVLDPFFTIPETNMNLLRIIIDARRKDALMEALRWFDIRRFRIEYSHTSYDQRTSIFLGKNDPRRVLQIPPQAVSVGLERNPR